MKQLSLKSLLTTLMLIACISGFSQEIKKTREAGADAAEVSKGLRIAKADSAADVQQFKKETEARINKNEKKIENLKVKKSNYQKNLREKYDKEILALNKRNDALKTKLKTCGDTKTDSWTLFKREFKHEMDKLTEAIDNFGLYYRGTEK